MVLKGTIILKFKELKDVPAVGNSLRICFQYKNGDGKNGDNWEKVSFFLPGWEESDWAVRFEKKGGLNGNWCSDALDNNNLIDDVWKIDQNYWDKDNLRMLLDVTRPLEFEDDNEWEAVSLDYDADLWLSMSYGVWNDQNHKDGGRTKGDRDTGKTQAIKVLNRGYMTTFAYASAAIAVAASLY